MKYKEWLNEWLGDFVRNSSKDKTYRQYKTVVEKHIIPALGEYDLSEITAQAVQQFISAELSFGNVRTGDGLSPGSVNLIISVIQNSVKSAELLGYVPVYELDKIRRPKIHDKKVTCFTKAEQKKIEQAVIEDKRPKMIGILLCLYTGLRIGELMALEWKDIDFRNGKISVTKACHDSTEPGVGYIRVTEAPKTESSVRTIPIPRQIIPYLHEAQKKNISIYVVGSGEKILSIRSYQKSFDCLLKKLDIPHRGFHSLRHTFATRALECGMDVKTLSEILGHENPVITLKHYAHSMEDHKIKMMNIIGKNL